MSIKQPIYHEFDLNATSGNSRVISLTHTDDAHVDVIELCVKQQGAKVDITGATVVARMVLHSTADILLNDSVSCTINDAGNILIPFDNAAVQTRKGIVKIEVNITRSPDILTLQLPLWVKINGSILDDATVDPHSEGTIPELLEEVREELERVEGFATAEDVFEILDSALEGNPSVAPTLLIDNAIDQQFNPDGHWILYYIDSDDLRHNIFDFSNLPSGASDYTDLQNKPQINSHTLSGNQSSDDLGLQKKLTAGTNITIENDGTISASGGVTDYTQLNNLPWVFYYTADGHISSARFKGYLDAYEPVRILKSGADSNPRFTILLESDKTLNVGTYSFSTNYDINDVSSNMWRTIILSAQANSFSNLPSFVHADYNRKVGFIQFAGYHVHTAMQVLYWFDSNSERHIATRIISNEGIHKFSDWVELTNGSQIVSGVVNQNGTITFTDSDGNTFTTTGSSVIGADGFSPTATVTQTQSGATVTITDKNGTTTANISNGADGQDYVLTAQDKSDIADIVLSELPTTQGVLYGNTSN